MRTFSPLVLLTLFACNSGGDDSGETGNTGDTGPTAACADFGPSGGILELGEASLRVPSGALDGDVELCLETGQEEAPADYTLLSPVYTISPVVVLFTADVTLTVPAEATDGFLAGYFSIDGETWAAQVPTRVGDKVEIVGNRGGSYVAAELGRSTDEASFDTVPPQDVLFVVDDSCSMSEEQAKLASGFQAFFDEISGIDWHVGIVTTDMVDFARRGKLVAHTDGDVVLDPTDANPVARFNSMVLVGTDGDADERGRDAAYAALVTRADQENAGFLRDDSGLSIVFISDEDDYSTGAPEDLDTFLAARTFTPQVFSIVGMGGGDWNSCSLEEGVKYRALSTAYPGGEHDICAESFEQVLTDIGVGVQGGNARIVELSLVPQVDTIEVSTVDDSGAGTVVEASGWVYSEDRNTVRLVERPQEAFTMRVSYVPAFE